MTDTGVADEQPVDIHQYARALRVALPRIAKVAVAAAAIAVVVSFIHPSHGTYRASATVVARDTINGDQTAAPTTVAQRLSTVSLLTGTTRVLSVAARHLHDTTVADLRSAVHSSVDPSVGAIKIGADAPTPAAAKATASAVAAALISAEHQIETQATADARRGMLAEIAQLRARGADKFAIQAVENQLALLTAGAIGSASGFQLLQTSDRPVRSAPTSPLLSGIVVFCAVGLLGILFVLAREQISPRLSSARDLREFFGIPVLTSIPVVTSFPLFSRLKGRDLSRMPTVLRDAFYILASAVRDEALRHDARVVLVTSAGRGQGRTAVAATLGQALGASGTRVLVVSADLRGSRVGEWLGTPESPGLTDVLHGIPSDGAAGDVPEKRPVSVASRVNESLEVTRPASRRARDRRQAPELIGRELSESRPAAVSARAMESAIRASTTTRYSTVNVLPAGTPHGDHMGMVFGDALPSLFTQLRELRYDVIVVDGPPVLESADFTDVAQYADAILVVVRADRMAMGTAVEVRHALEPLDAKRRYLAVIDRRRHPLTARTTAEPKEGSVTNKKVGEREVVELR
jgi:Mrp family chromosome partitioning ATPase/capsular polysaccharide biosynthesis protein